ncbi:hypothetical protein PAXRUDRAFT_822550 [Paxillus rubicundulus Ve08.2h10]|uniref:Uncharacterized protein n=1 Tax=Paxillus rubicundulus Ve08.2h10 TaxID=930991 RepID=A0A0D0DLU2_9AGAM|nr:hypothetical protein PAXRUDRAFT_822550 [Paxillus rubicundulus Ve08.2h10]
MDCTLKKLQLTCIDDPHPGVPSKFYSLRGGVCNAAQTMEESTEQAVSWRRSIHRVLEIMVDTSRTGDTGKGLCDKNQPGSIRRGVALARGANTRPMAGAVKGRTSPSVAIVCCADSISVQYQNEDVGLQRTTRRRFMVVSNPDPFDESDTEVEMMNQK